MLKKSAACLLLGVAPTLFGMPPYTATYSLYYHGIKAASVTQVFKPLENGKYLFSNTVEPILAILPYGGFERSIFKMGPDHILPLRYDFEKREGSFQEGVIVFDHKNKLAKEASTKHNGNMAYTPGDHDKQTYFIQLTEDLKANKPVLSYNILGDGKTRHYTFTRMGNETLDTPLGKIKTMKLKQENDDHSRVTYLWLDPKRDYLLIHIVQVRKGSVAGESTIETFEKR